MKDPIVVAASNSVGSDFVDSETGWRVIFLIGLGATIVDLLDLVWLFVPPRFASLEWEYGTIGGLFDGLPLLTIGVGLMAAAVMASNWRRMRTVVVLLSFLVSLAILILGAIFALDVAPIVRAQNDPGQAYVLKLGSLKTGLEGAVYFLLYLALGVWTWRRNRKTKRAGGVK